MLVANGRQPARDAEPERRMQRHRGRVVAVGDDGDQLARAATAARLQDPGQQESPQPAAGGLRRLTKTESSAECR